MIDLTPHVLHVLVSSHTYASMLDRDEPELEEPSKQTQVEDITNLDLDQGKARCIPPIILDFSFNCYLYVSVTVH
jgi:hypothetical protein